MPESTPVKKVEGQKESDSLLRQSLDSRGLFNLSCDILCRKQLSPRILEYIENILPERSLFFLLSGDSYIHPKNFAPIPPDTIWDIIGNNNAGIFRRQVQKDRNSSELGGTVCTGYIGKDLYGGKMAAGLIYAEGWGNSGKCEDDFYDFMTHFRRFYNEFSGSRAVTDFISDESAFRYAIDSVTNEIIVRRLPSKGKYDVNAGFLDRQIIGNNLLQILLPDSARDDHIILDDNMRNLNMARCTILGVEYILLSFKAKCSHNGNIAELDRLINGFSHRIKGKLSALQIAANQLILQEGEIIDDDDITLASIIQSSTESINSLVRRLDQFAHCAASGSTLVDLNQMISEITRRKKGSLGSMPEVKLTLDPEIGLIEANTEQIELALGELLDNAVNACEKQGRIEIDTTRDAERVSLSFRNDISNPRDNSVQYNALDLFNPFFSLKPDRTGMGLTIARRIILNHGGDIEISNDKKTEFKVTVDIPTTPTRSCIINGQES